MKHPNTHSQLHLYNQHMVFYWIQQFDNRLMEKFDININLLCYQANFGHSRSNHISVINGDLPKN